MKKLIAISLSRSVFYHGCLRKINGKGSIVRNNRPGRFQKHHSI